MSSQLPVLENKDCRIRIGLTELLPEFLDLCSYAGSSTFFLAAPFVDENLIEDISSRFAKEKIIFHIVVPDEIVSARLQSRVPHRSIPFVKIHVCRHLHAKVYLCETRSREFIGLIGSHNPTRAGTTTNVEVGVLLFAKSGTPEWLQLADLRAALCERSRPYHLGVEKESGGNQDVEH